MSEIIDKDDLVHFCKKIALMSEIYVNDFYNLTKLSPEDQITKPQFLGLFESVKGIRFIKLVTDLTTGYENKWLNFEDNSKNKDLLKRLNEIQMKQAKRFLKDKQLSEKETGCLREFLETEIEGHEKHIGTRFFKDIKNAKLRKYFFDCFMAKVQDRQFVEYIINSITKLNREAPKLEFLFDVFGVEKEQLNAKQIKDFIEIFELSPDHFGKATTISKDKFVELTTDCDLNFGLYE